MVEYVVNLSNLTITEEFIKETVRESQILAYCQGVSSGVLLILILLWSAALSIMIWGMVAKPSDRAFSAITERFLRYFLALGFIIIAYLIIIRF
jgi:hypothetical protein